MEGIDLCLNGPTFSTAGWGRFSYESDHKGNCLDLNCFGRASELAMRSQKLLSCSCVCLSEVKMIMPGLENARILFYLFG